jgi:hypothetical protein
MVNAVTIDNALSLSLLLEENIRESFDFYFLAETAIGNFTLYLNGNYRTGLKASYRCVPGANAPRNLPVFNNRPLPQRVYPITFYAIVLQAGKRPPGVTGPAQIDANTPYVLSFSKITVP